MFKKFILFFPVLCFLLTVMCSCTNGQSEKETTTAVKNVKDSTGKVFSSIVGGDGFLLLGDRDELAVTVDDGKGKPGKNAKGEYVTKVEPFSGVLTVGKEVQTKFVRMPLPEKWTNESDDLIKLRYEKDGLSVKFTVNERSGLSVKECQAEIESLMSGIAECKKEKSEFSFAEAVKLDYESKVLVYIFNIEGRTYFVKVNGDEKLLKETDFEEIINTMKFRKGE